MVPTDIDNRPRSYERPTLIVKKPRDSIAAKDYSIVDEGSGPNGGGSSGTNDGIYLQYRFEEDGNEETLKYNLTSYGSPNFSNYVELDGVDDYLSVGINFEVKTLSYWFNLTDVNTDNYLLSFDNDFYIKVNSNSLDVQTDNENNCNISKDFFNGIWYNLALTSNNENYDIYLNNTKLPETIIYKDLSSSTLNIGAYITNSDSKYLNGKIADLRLYNTIKTADEINTIYNEYNYVLKFEYKPNDLIFTFREDESPYSWQEAYDEAIANGKRMPTKTELLNYLSSLGYTLQAGDTKTPLYNFDAWCPVIAPEYSNGKDWIQIGNYPHHYVGLSHTEASGYPNWGDNSTADYSKFYCEVLDQTEYTVNFPENTICDILIVGGGGAGGASVGGGGGAGGVVYQKNIILNGTYNIYVGKGGNVTTSTNLLADKTCVDNGISSLIKYQGNTYTLNGIIYEGKGGGGGGSRIGEPPNNLDGGFDGGSGGGSSLDGDGNFQSPGVSTQGNTFNLSGTNIPGGNNGGTTSTSTSWLGSGGGGAGGPGDGKNGGIGVEIDITGTNIFYAAGGGAGRNSTSNAGIGGSGIGGDGKRNTTENGTLYIPTRLNGLDGTGSGGGGGGYDYTYVQSPNGNPNGDGGGAGGSGVVIIRKLTSIIYDFSHITSLADWNTYATDYGFNSTFDAGFQEANYLYYTGVWTHDEATGFISKEIPAGYTKLRVEYQALWDNTVSIYITPDSITNYITLDPTLDTNDITETARDTVTVAEGLKIFEATINPDTDKYLTVAERYSTLSTNLRIVFY